MNTWGERFFLISPPTSMQVPNALGVDKQKPGLLEPCRHSAGPASFIRTQEISLVLPEQAWSPSRA